MNVRETLFRFSLKLTVATSHDPTVSADTKWTDDDDAITKVVVRSSLTYFGQG